MMNYKIVLSLLYPLIFQFSYARFLIHQQYGIQRVFYTTNILRSNASNRKIGNTCTQLKSSPQSSLKEREQEQEEVDSALIRRINAEILAESGVELEQLINPSKVVNLEREIINLTAALSDDSNVLSAEEQSRIQEKIAKKKATLSVEKRSVMRSWLKNLFVGQSVLAAVASLLMVYNIVPGYEGQLPLSVKVLGFWMWWLFIIPSLRARKPSNAEKEALNISFLGSPLISLALPAVTKDVALIWWANAAVVAASYGYAYLLKPSSIEEVSESVTDPEGDSLNAEETNAVGALLVKAFKALDYGSGQERGGRPR